VAAITVIPIAGDVNSATPPASGAPTPLHRERAGRVQPEGVALEIVRGQSDQLTRRQAEAGTI
jgi:hypothetical protein